MTTAANPGPDAPALTYEQARDLAATGDRMVRCTLAARTDLAPEILYYLAEDPDPGVRGIVGTNPATPARGNLLLADDDTEAVRLAVAEKVAAHRASHSLTGRILDRLARDRLSAVRAAIADGLKGEADLDPDLIRRLARDVEILVAAPVLEYSPVLSDDDLLAIIRDNPAQGALAAIARRAYVDPRVTEAIVASGDGGAVTHLLHNARAQLQEQTLDALVARAAEEPDWQPPLVHRPELRAESARHLAAVVAEHLLGRLLDRKDLGADTAARVADAVNARLCERLGDGAAALPAPRAAEVAERFEPLLDSARAQQAGGALDEPALMVALLTDHADELVAGLAVRAGLPVRAALEMVAAQAPRALCALAWAADLSPRFALELQLKLGRIARDAALHPREDGSYPLNEADLAWQRDMYRDAAES